MALSQQESEKISKAAGKGVNFSFPFASVLTLIFVIAKLTNTVNWSWWIVFLPIILEFGIAVAIMIIAVIVLIALERGR